MKHLLLTTLLLLLQSGLTTTCTVNNNSNQQQQSTEYVYICTGSSSKCYHKHDKCRGLQKCGKEIKKVTLQDAKTKYNRRPCTYCYGKQ